MIDNSMRNTFGVLTNRCTMEEILSDYSPKDGEIPVMFYGNPLDITDEDIKEMIEYFENTEEYEYCTELKELLTAKNFADFDIWLEELVKKNGVTMY